jgi:hypothetical protein
MAYLVAGVLVLVVVGAAWFSSRRGKPASGCCAPADPRADLRMRAAYDDGENRTAPGEPLSP